MRVFKLRNVKDFMDQIRQVEDSVHPKNFSATINNNRGNLYAYINTHKGFNIDLSITESPENLGLLIEANIYFPKHKDIDPIDVNIQPNFTHIDFYFTDVKNHYNVVQIIDNLDPTAIITKDYIKIIGKKDIIIPFTYCGYAYSLFKINGYKDYFNVLTNQTSLFKSGVGDRIDIDWTFEKILIYGISSKKDRLICEDKCSNSFKINGNDNLYLSSKIPSKRFIYLNSNHDILSDYICYVDYIISDISSTKPEPKVIRMHFNKLWEAF